MQQHCKGIAATILTLGKKFLRQFGAPIPIQDNSTSNIKLNSRQAHVIREASLIIVDEMSIMDWKLLTFLDIFLKMLTKIDACMGGKCVILMGNLRQCPPVVTGGNRPAIVVASVINTECWHEFKTHKLERNMRVEQLTTDTNQERIDLLRKHCKWLLDLGKLWARHFIDNLGHQFQSRTTQLQTSS